MAQASRKRDRYISGVEPRGNGLVAKSFGDMAIVEYQKALALEAALAGTRFLVPRAVRCDESSGYIEYEFLPDCVLLMEVIEHAVLSRKYRRVLALNDAAGELLGLVHRRLKVDPVHRWEPPEDLRRQIIEDCDPAASSDDVFLHCDYSPVNLLVTPNLQLAVIDPSPSRGLTGSGFPNLFGHRLVDVANYTAKLFWPYRLRNYTIAGRRLASVLRRRFLAAYERTCGLTVHRDLLRHFEYAATRSFVQWKTKRFLVRWGAMAVARVGLYRGHE